MQSNVMSDRLEAHFGPSTKSMSVRQTRRGWCQELIGCEAPDEFKWFDTTDNRSEQFGISLEDSDCCLRVCCPTFHPFTMTLKEINSNSEIMKLERPMTCPAGPCKCCCLQEMTFSSQGQTLGKIEEKCYICVPRMLIVNSQGFPTYKVHPPTCCAGMCVYPCAEGNPCCGAGCCKLPFHIFPADQLDTDNGAAHIGKIVKVPKSLRTEIFTDAEAYDIIFPEDATVEQKALIAGSSVFIDSNYFENQDNTHENIL